MSSADDAQFKSLKRPSSSLMTASTNNSDNITALNVHAAMINNNGGTMTATNQSTHCASTGNDSVAKSYCITRKDKLESSETKDLLICLIFVLKNLSHDDLLGLWYNYEECEFVDFLSLLDLCLRTFKYRGRANIEKLHAISKTNELKLKSPPKTDPNTRGASFLHDAKSHSTPNGKMNPNQQQQQQHQPLNQSLINDTEQSAVIESNLCHQISLIVMRILSLILIHHKEKLSENHGDNQLVKQLTHIYFYLLESNQSEIIKLKTFSSLRLLINKTPLIFLDGHNSTLCGQLCLELLKCFSSKYQSIRIESSIVIYLLMRKNYEFTKFKSISLVHSQIIISVSQLIGTMKLANSAEVLECLANLNNLAINDQKLRNTNFSLDVKDLTKRIKNIFMATSQMKTYQDDAEMLIDSQYSLAKSYAQSLELRRTWLDSMASLHMKEKNFSEAAHCYLHIAALIAENLKHQGMYTLGSSVFRKITPNIDLEDDMNDSMNDFSMMEEQADLLSNGGDLMTPNDLNQVQYTQTQLLDYLIKSTEMLKMAERFDSLPNIFKLAVAIYETNRDYEVNYN